MQAQTYFPYLCNRVCKGLLITQKCYDFLYTYIHIYKQLCSYYYYYYYYLSHVSLSSPLMFFWVFFVMFQLLLAAQKHSTFHNMKAVPRMADNCALPTMSGIFNFSCQDFAFFDIVPSAPMTIGITVTFDALWILVISSARS